MRRLALLLILSLFAVPGLTIARVQREQLDPRIGLPVREKHKAVQDAKVWRNPYLIVCPGNVRSARPAPKLRICAAVMPAQLPPADASACVSA